MHYDDVMARLRALRELTGDKVQARLTTRK